MSSPSTPTQVRKDGIFLLPTSAFIATFLPGGDRHRKILIFQAFEPLAGQGLPLGEGSSLTEICSVKPCLSPEAGVTDWRQAEDGKEDSKRSTLRFSAQRIVVPAPAYVFLASDADSSYITGIVLAEMGGLTTEG
jgi:hypothetical protein